MGRRPLVIVLAMASLLTLTAVILAWPGDNDDPEAAPGSCDFADALEGTLSQTLHVSYTAEGRADLHRESDVDPKSARSVTINGAGFHSVSIDGETYTRVEAKSWKDRRLLVLWPSTKWLHLEEVKEPYRQSAAGVIGLPEHFVQAIRFKRPLARAGEAFLVPAMTHPDRASSIRVGTWTTTVRDCRLATVSYESDNPALARFGDQLTFSDYGKAVQVETPDSRAVTDQQLFSDVLFRNEHIPADVCARLVALAGPRANCRSGTLTVGGLPVLPAEVLRN
jgi:hypothetical protein